MALIRANTSGGSGTASWEMVGVTKGGGSTALSIPTTKKAVTFTIAAPSSSAAWVYAFNNATSTLEYWYNGAHSSASDISVTVTFNNNDISISTFSIASGEKKCLVTVIYAD